MVPGVFRVLPGVLGVLPNLLRFSTRPLDATSVALVLCALCLGALPRRLVDLKLLSLCFTPGFSGAPRLLGRPAPLLAVPLRLTRTLA